MAFGLVRFGVQGRRRGRPGPTALRMTEQVLSGQPMGSAHPLIVQEVLSTYAAWAVAAGKAEPAIPERSTTDVSDDAGELDAQNMIDSPRGEVEAEPASAIAQREHPGPGPGQSRVSGGGVSGPRRPSFLVESRTMPGAARRAVGLWSRPPGLTARSPRTHRAGFPARRCTGPKRRFADLAHANS